MNLLDVFRRSKKASSPGYLGGMWACAVKFEPAFKPGRRYGAVVKNVGIVEAFARNGKKYVTSGERDPFGDGSLAGPVGYLKYSASSHTWIGFFETEDEAKEGYRRFAYALLSEIKSASVKLGLTGETGKAPAA